MKKRIYICFFCILLLMCLVPARKTYAKEDLVIVIDPGHGGENLGAEWNGYTEKDLTMIIASAMKEELEKYEGVKVYFTHEDDGDYSLQKRCDIAHDLQADFLFCLHLNMSETHELYGSEVWIPSKGTNYVKGYQFASIVLHEFENKGLYNRGIKTRLNPKGQEYYGILRHSEEYGIPCALVEHCHMDHDKDASYYESTESLKQLGILDATAAAKYFGLHSSVLNVTYEGYELENVEAPSVSIAQDLSPADYVELEVNGILEDSAEILCTLEADDYDSYILYYSYSLDGGVTYSELYPFNRGTAVSFVAKFPYDEEIDLVARVYNKYDQTAESKTISLGNFQDPAKAVMEETTEESLDLESSVSFEMEEDELKSTSEDAISYQVTPKNGSLMTTQKKLMIIGALFLLSVFSVVISAFISMQMVRKSHKKDKD